MYISCIFHRRIAGPVLFIFMFMMKCMQPGLPGVRVPSEWRAARGHYLPVAAAPCRALARGPRDPRKPASIFDSDVASLAAHAPVIQRVR